MKLESLLRHLPTRFSPETSLRGLFLTISLLLGTVAWVGVAYSQKRLSDFRLAMSERVDLQGQQQQLQTQSQTLEQQAAEAKADCGFLIAKLPSGPSESEFLTLLSNAASQFDVTLGDYRPGSVHTLPTASQMELRLRATGSYTGLCQWLDNMTQLPRLVHINHLTLIGPASRGGDCTVDLQLMIVFGFSDKVH